MKRKKLWISLALIVVLAGIGFFFRRPILQMIRERTGVPVNASSRESGGGFDRANAQNRPGGFGGDTEGGPAGFDLENVETTTIRPAAGADQVSAAGNIALISRQSAVVQVEGTGVYVAVEVGDQVLAGDLLLALDTTDLERALQRAELSLAGSQAQLDKLMEPADPAAISNAQAGLAAALENLTKVQAGPGETELIAAETGLASAQAHYQELLAGSSEAELTQLGVNLQKALIALEQAQAAYDKIAYSSDVSSKPQAATLQQATIDYEAAKAAYEIATEPPSEASKQEALSAVQNAQYNLETLRSQPTAADLAAAMAQVTGAEAQLAQLVEEPSAADLRAAEINVAQAELNLEEAKANLAQAELYAPIDGTILAINIEVGNRVSPGQPVVTLADLNALELTVNVAEVDIRKIEPNRGAEITIDAFPDQIFSGSVSRIAPASTSEQGVVNYPVTIRLTDSNLSGVRPGMTAVATILGDKADDGWLVPTNAIRERRGNTIVIVVRDGQPSPVPVTKGASQGEWTIVQAAELQAGDEVVGAVSSFLNQDENQQPGFGRGFGAGRPPGGGPGGPGGGRGN